MPHPLLFDHFPKTGGSSIIKWLKPLYCRQRSWTKHVSDHRFREQFLAKSQTERIFYRYVTGHWSGVLEPHCREDIYLTTILREPVDRTVSLYYYWKSKGRHCPLGDIRGTQIEPFFMHYRDMLSNECVKYYATQIGDEVSVDRAFERLSDYDMIGHFPAVDYFAYNLRKKLKLQQSFGQRYNNRGSRPAVEELPRSTVDLLTEINQLDLQLWNRRTELSCLLG